EIVLHQQVVGFVIETPLADDEIGTGVLDPVPMLSEAHGHIAGADLHLDHVQELFPLILSQLLVLFNTLDVQLVLCL
nr:hypothetical protein [Tanacetum cinerariifolium]